MKVMVNHMELTEVLMLQCMMSHILLAFALSVSGHPVSYQNQTECPLWFYYNSSMHGCQCLPYWQLTCEGNDTFIDSGYISTYSKNSRLLSVIVAKKYGAFGGYNTTKPGYIMLPKKISRLNEYMCGPLNRKGHLCGECSDGYGPSMILTGCTDMCYNLSLIHI